MNEIPRETISDLLVWIEYNIQTSLRIADVAERAGYSRYHLQRIFKKYTGVPLARYIRELKLAHAARTLLENTGSIAGISESYGYVSQQTFNRIFTRQFSLTPGKWRALMKHQDLYPAILRPVRLSLVSALIS